MNKLLYFSGFALGVISGAVATYCVLNKKYAEREKAAVESVKETFAKRQDNETAKRESMNKLKDAMKTVEKIATDARNKPGIMDYAAKLKEEGYVDYSTKMEKEEKKDVGAMPYVIPPDEFGDLDEYERISLTYYADGVLTDDADEPYDDDDVDEIVGKDFADHFGEYEDDSVFVRNDARMCDYEILRDERTYEEVSGKKPRRVEIDKDEESDG